MCKESEYLQRLRVQLQVVASYSMAAALIPTVKVNAAD